MQQQGDGRSRALLWMLSGAALIGTNALMVRFADTPPTISAFYRMLFAGLMLLAVILLQRGWRPMPRQVWWWSAAAGAAFAADLWLWHRSILLVGPGLATLLANGQVFFMALAGMVLFGERVGPRFMAGIGLAVFGLYLMLGGDWDTLPEGYRLGVLAGLGTGLCYALYNLALRRAQGEAHAVGTAAGHLRAPIVQVLALVSLMCALLLGMAGLAEGSSFVIPSWQTLGWLLVLAGFGHCLSWVLISRAMAHLSVAVIGLLLLLQPIVAFLLDLVVLDLQVEPRAWLGLALTLAGIFLASLRGRSRLPAQAA